MSDKYLSEKDIEEFFKEESKETDYFQCINCSKQVSLDAPGTNNRNHCPYCLYSQHVDRNVGDRIAECGGKMKPIGRFKRPNGEDVLVHECVKCGKISNNRIAGDDDYNKVTSLKVVEDKLK